MNPEELTPEARVAAMLDGSEAIAVALDMLADAMRSVAEVRRFASTISESAEILRLTAATAGRLSQTVADRNAEIARLTAERDALHAAALDAIRAAWRSGYLAAMDDHETGEDGDPDGCHDPEDYLQEAMKEPA